MSPLSYLKVALALLLIGLGYFAYSTWEKYTLAKAEIKQVKAELVAVIAQKKKSDQAQAELTTKLNEAQVVTTKTITRLVKVPVVVQEKCMSPVLQEALKEEGTND